jgi:poly(3-hydroxybutyrate) depolymerase
VFPHCQEGFTVELYTIETLGHKVPNLSEFPLAELMWAFFEAHRKP